MVSTRRAVSRSQLPIQTEADTAAEHRPGGPAGGIGFDPDDAQAPDART